MDQTNFNNSNKKTEQVVEASIVSSKCHIKKNLVFIALGTLLILVGDDMVLMFQSTLNSENGVGIASVAVQYASLFISSLTLPKYLVLKYGSKTIMVLAILLHIPFFVNNYYPTYSVMMLTSVLSGVGFSLLWGSIDPYINTLASMYVDNEFEKVALNSCKERQSSRHDSTCSHLTSTSFSLINIPINTFHHTSNVILFKEKIESNLEVINQPNTSENFGKDYSTRKNITNVSEQIENAKVSYHNRFNMSEHMENKYITNENGSSLSEHSKKQMGSLQTLTSYTKLKKEMFEATNVRFFSFHSMIYQICYILSNLSSFFVLQSGYSSDFQPSSFNDTSLCGVNYRNVELASLGSNLQQPSAEARDIFISICVGLGVLSAVFVIAFLEDLKRKETDVSFSADMVWATFHQMKKKKNWLLAPLIINFGLIKAFFIGDFTKSYIGCAWGIQYVGLVALCCSISMVFFSLVSGWFTKHVGRLPVFLSAFAINTMMNVLLITWHPDASSPSMFFVTAGLFGCLIGTLYTQIRAFYGALFKKDEEAAFGAFQLWYSVGGCLSLSYSEHLGNDIKVYIMIVASTIGIIGYLVVERGQSTPCKTSATCRQNDNTIEITKF